MRHGDHLGAEPHAIAELDGDRRREQIVATFDPVHRADAAAAVGPELIDERDQRQLLGIRQKEST